MGKVRKTLLKVAIVSTSVLMSIVLTGAEIAKYNSGAISGALKQPTFEQVQKPGTEGQEVDKEYYKSKYNSIAELNAAGKLLAEKIQAEGSVLLKNENNALPLAKNAKVSLFGTNSEIPSYGGRGSAQTRNPQPAVDLYDGFAQAGMSVNPEVKRVNKASLTRMHGNGHGGYYRVDYAEIPFDDVKGDAAAMDSLSEYNTAVYFLSRTGGESMDLNVKATVFDGMTGDQKDAQERRTLNLSGREKATLKGLADLKAAGKINKIIVVFNSTNQLEFNDFLSEYNIDAMVWAGHYGITGTVGLAKLLNGTYNPSGSLPDTFYKILNDNPTMLNYPLKKYKGTDAFPEFGDELKGGHFNTYFAYQEGIYVGYRYSETRYTDVVEKRENAGDWKYEDSIAYPFGYGLSYTKFDYSDFTATKTETGYDLSVKVTNTGTVAGKNSAEFYLQKPFNDYDIKHDIEKPAVELVAFDKTKELAPGASEVVSVSVDGRMLAAYDDKDAETYVVTPGKYLFTAAQDVHEAANNFLASKGKTETDGMTKAGKAALVKSFDLEEDTTTYSTSEQTGHKITNLFKEANLNTYKGRGNNTMEFMTRTNWSKKIDVELTATKELVNDLLSQLDSSNIEKGTGKYPTYGANNGLQLIQLLKDDEGNRIAYDDPIWQTLLDQLSWDDTVELVRFGYRGTKGITSIGKPDTLEDNGPTGLTNSFDAHENGLATRKDDPDKSMTPVYYPSVPVVAASFSPALAEEWGDMLGEEALWNGYNGFYGVGLNTHRCPYAGRHFEYWSEDPVLAGLMAARQVEKMQSHGLAAYIKHFALNDQEMQRTNVQVWSNEQALREISLRPFELAITEGGALNAMVSFTRIGATMTPGCRPLLKDFLRDECGMEGVIITDMYNIGYKKPMWQSFIMAGCDIPDSDKILAEEFDQYKTGYPALAHRMREAAHRICYETLNSNRINGMDSNTIVRKITPPWQKALLGVEITSIVLFSGAMLWGAAELILVLKKRFTK